MTNKTNDFNNSTRLRVIGTNLHRKEGIAKVTGRSIYADDMSFENCLYGKTIRSTVARGLIKEIRFGEGVPWDEFVIVLPSDIPGKNAVTLIDELQPFLAEKEIKHQAEPLALIAHPDKHLVEKARRCVEIEVKELPAIFSIEDAQEGDNIQYGNDNVFKAYALQSGDPDEAFADADLIVEEVYRTGAQEQLYIEPNIIIAQAEPGENVTIWGSMQCPFYIQNALVALFGLDPEKIRVIQTETGGAFGGKEEYPNMIAGHAALLSWKSGGRPVKMVYDRQEDLWATTKRHPSKTWIKAGFKKDGTLVALDIDFNLDGGAYPTLTPVVLSRGLLHAWGPYKCGHTRIRACAWMTNSIPYGAFRGFGAPQSIFALELHMTRCAHELRIGSASLRRKNLYHEGDKMPTGQVIKDKISLETMLGRALEKYDYDRKRREHEELNSRKGPKRKGIGLSLFFHGAGFTGSGEVVLASELAMRLTEIGGVEVLAANVEYGQGTNTTLTQIASEACNIPPEWVVVHQPDTQVVPNSGPTVASRTTMIVGELVARASRKLIEELRQTTGLSENYNAEDFRQAVLNHLKERGGLKVSVKHRPPKDIHWDEENYCGDAYCAYSWSCDVAEVEVDLIEYTAKVTDFVSIVECGQVINPLLASGQIEGGIVQGIGFALYEHCVMHKGAMQNHQHTNYIIPTSADTPDIQVEFVTFPHSNHGTYSAKGIGELPMDGPAPAISGALAQALGGIFINEIPLLPEKIMAAVNERDISTP